MIARHRKRFALWFWICLAQSYGVSVAEFGELTLDEVRRRHRS